MSPVSAIFRSDWIYGSNRSIPATPPLSPMTSVEGIFEIVNGKGMGGAKNAGMKAKRNVGRCVLMVEMYSDF